MGLRRGTEQDLCQKASSTPVAHALQATNLLEGQLPRKREQKGRRCKHDRHARHITPIDTRNDAMFLLDRARAGQLKLTKMSYGSLQKCRGSMSSVTEEKERSQWLVQGTPRGSLVTARYGEA